MSEVIRPAEAGDLPAILSIMRTSLGWPDDRRAEALWRWKHELGPFGASPVWVGETDGAVVAVRTFMRWELLRADGTVLRAVRAVDTATHPDHQGRGWFRRLTMHGLEHLAAEGVGIVFNTPNDQSRPGYLKMGWEEQTRQAAWVRVLRPAAVTRLWRSRVPAELWPEPYLAGMVPAEAFAREDVASLVEQAGARPTEGAVTTNRTLAFYRWRYGLPELGYRVVAGAAGPGQGFAVVRRRQRGASHELAVLDVVAPAANESRTRHAALRRTRCDHAVALGDRPGRSWLPVPGLGPRLVARTVDGSPIPGSFRLGLGDVELL